MGQTAEEYDDGQIVAENLIENIISEVTRHVNERKDSCFDSFESLKLQTFGSEDILEFRCSRSENKVETKVYGNKENDKNPNADVCFPRLAHLPEVYIHSSSLPNTSKQGEGDFQHPVIREAVAFYRLEEQGSRPSGSKNCCSRSCATDEDTACDRECVENPQKDMGCECDQVTKKPDNNDLQEARTDCKSCTSSLISATSCNELIEDLQRNINNLSFDDVHLSDSEDDGSQPHRSSADRRSPVASCSRDACEYSSDDQVVTQHDTKDSHEEQPYVQQSTGFWHWKENKNFSDGDFPTNYYQLVNEGYDKYELISQEEEEQELLSNGSSDEMVIIEREEIDQLPDVNWYDKGNWDHPMNPQCRLVYGENSSVDSNFDHELWKPSRPFNTVTVVADVHEQNWEEFAEVQVNDTDLIESSESEDKEDGGDGVKFKQYLTSVGLVTEKVVNPLHKLYLSNSENGIESVPGVTRVQETVVKRGSRNCNREYLESEEELEREIKNNSQLDGICAKHRKKTLRRDEHDISYEISTIQDIEIPCVNQSDDNKLNYLNFADRASGGVKKKNKLIARITRSFTNLFRSKKKNPKS